ncbi:MAG: histidine kinase [Sphingomonas aquatilis]|uniref:histidine kinase n=1 Tax=Sphingomonas aquatilis TaxID=93063 RepID=UPI002F2EB087
MTTLPFKIVKQPRAWWPVAWPGVAEDGTLVDNRIELRMRLLKVDEAGQFIRDAMQAAEREGDEGVDLAAIYADLVARIADDWRNVHAENGEPLPWNAANLRLLMNEPNMFTHVFRAFRACLAGQSGIREGN